MSWLAEQYYLRRLSGKLLRKMRRLGGWPDPTPWILDPPRRQPASGLVDFIFALNYLGVNSRLLRMFHEAFSACGLSILLANQSNVAKITREIQSGWLRPHVYLDLCSRPGDDFDRLLHAASAAGIYTIINPADLHWTYKAEAHPVLEQAGLPLPPSVIFRADQPDRDLTPPERHRLGERLAIKPSRGGAHEGVVLNAPPTRKALAAARDFNRRDDWLVQKMMAWGRCGHRPAYLRAYHIFSHLSLLWWTYDDGYSPLTWQDLHNFDLLPAVRIINRLATLTQMDFFSTEIAITVDGVPDRFCLIDYVNDQCDLNPDVDPGVSPPESWCRWVVGLFARFVWHRKHHLAPPSAHRSLWLYADPPASPDAVFPRPAPTITAADAETAPV